MKREIKDRNTSRRSVVKGLILTAADLFTTKLFGATKNANYLILNSTLKHNKMENSVLTPIEVIKKFLELVKILI